MSELGECPNNTENTVCLSLSCKYKHDRGWPIPPAIQEAMEREDYIEALTKDAKALAKLEKTVREALEGERNFQAELAAVINKYSREGRSNTPDFILAGYLVNCLEAYEAAMERRDEW